MKSKVKGRNLIKNTIIIIFLVLLNLALASFSKMVIVQKLQQKTKNYDEATTSDIKAFNGIEHVDNEGNLYVTYEDFGAKGFGYESKDDDLEAIIATHNYANNKYVNENRMITVKGNDSNNEKVYYIGEISKSISIGTNVDWSNCTFIFDDGINGTIRQDLTTPVFSVKSKLEILNENNLELHGLQFSSTTMANFVNQLNRFFTLEGRDGATTGKTLELNNEIQMGQIQIDKNTENLEGILKYIDYKYQYLVSDEKKNANYVEDKREIIKNELEGCDRYLVEVFNGYIKEYVRYGSNANNGNTKKDMFIIDKSGNISDETKIVNEFYPIIANTVEKKAYELKMVNGEITKGEELPNVVVDFTAIEGKGLEEGPEENTVIIPAITILRVYPVYDNTITINGGNIITLTNNVVYVENTGDGGTPYIKKPYIRRNIYINSVSGIKIKNISHYLDEKIYPYQNIFQTSPTNEVGSNSNVEYYENANLYQGILEIERCANIDFENINISAHTNSKLVNYSNRKTSITTTGNGTYDLSLNSVLNIKFDKMGYVDNSDKNIKYSLTDEEEHYPNNYENAYYENMINTNKRWSTIGMNYVKNLNVKDSYISVLSSHADTYNVKVQDSVIGKRGIILSGGGTLEINNVTVDQPDSLLKFHDDYGATWNGKVILNNIYYILPNTSSDLFMINSKSVENHKFGYQRYFPNVFMNNIKLYDKYMSNESKIYLIGIRENSTQIKNDDTNLYYMPENIQFKNLQTISNNENIDLNNKKDVPSKLYSINEEKAERSLYIFSDNFIYTMNYLSQERYKNEGENQKTNIEIYNNVDLKNDEINKIEGIEISNKQFNIISLVQLEVEFEGYNEINENGKKYIENIQPKTTLEEFVSEDKIKTNGTIEVIKNGEKITNSETKISTGMMLKISLNNEAIEYTIVVKGDTNGDGDSNISDIMQINKHRLKKTQLTNENFLAGDVNKNDIIDINDLMKINKYRLKKIDSL